MNIAVRVLIDQWLTKLVLLDVKTTLSLLLALLVIQLLLLAIRHVALPVLLLLVLIGLAQCPMKSRTVAHDRSPNHYASPFDAEPGSWR